AIRTGQEVLDGGPGDDLLDGGQAPDVLIGGDGNDTVTYEGRSEAITASIDGAANDGGDSDLDPISLRRDGIASDVENILGGSVAGGGGTGTADESSSLVSVTSTPNGVADDGASGEGDNVGGDVESATGGSDDDVLSGNGGNGTLSGGSGNDLLDGGAGADVMSGGAGVDTANYSGRTAAVTVTLDGAANDGEAGEGDNVDTEKVLGGSADDK